MYIVACACCQTRLTETLFTNYVDAAEAARGLGYPAEDSDEFWCDECATKNAHARDAAGNGSVSHR